MRDEVDPHRTVLHSFAELRTKAETNPKSIEVELLAELRGLSRARLVQNSRLPIEVEDIESEFQILLKLGEYFQADHLSFLPHLDRNGKNSRPPELQRLKATTLLSTARLLELDVKTIARPSYSRELVPHIGNDGSGLATVLAWLQGERPEDFETIQTHLREFVPEVERVRLRRAPVRIADTEVLPVGHDESGKAIYTTLSVQREEIGSEILLDFRHAKGVPAKHASEGTLLLGLLSVVHTGDVSVLLLDDIDRALHPKAQQQLVHYLRRLTEQGIQVIATSHSPYLVLHLEYEEVRIMTMSESGGALIGKPSDHPEYERWCESMTPSEFWTVFGGIPRRPAN